MRNVLFIALPSLLLAFPVMATPAGSQFEQDRRFAERSLTSAEQQLCLQDVSAKMKEPASLKPAGTFHFNGPISRKVYDALYWNGVGRGVAFTLPVTVQDPVMGETAGNVACFYALTEGGVMFQHSQQISWRIF